MQLSADVERLFHEVADLSPSERSRVLAAQNITPQVRADVESLLSNDHPDDDTLNNLVRNAVNESVDSEVPVTARCGPYILLKLIGSGGMGSVYIAERADGELRHKVAIKLLRLSIDTAHARLLFHKERQILADLSHPNIAHLVDAGQADDGRPYFAMEFIDGTPIDEFCRHLSLPQRLQLFAELCGAIIYAHRMLVVHRDIKPGNILIDSSGAPKLLDFGIAKLLDEASDATVTAERRITPQFASPEQLMGSPVGAASDIFSLGVLLYLLTTGQPPFRREDYKDLSELEHAVCRNQPPRAGERNKDVDSDLDAIISMAMRKEPNERYASADAFREDVRAWLEHRPVRARQGNWWYVARRRLRRYWIPAAAAAVTIAGLAVGLGIAIHERNIAERRFTDVRKFAQDMLQVGNDIQSLAGATPARARIVKTSISYLEQLSRDAGSDLDLQTDIGAAYRAVAELQGGVGRANLGQSEAALASLAKSENFLRAVCKRRPNDVRAIRRLLLTVEDQYQLARELHRPGLVLATSGDLNVLATNYERIAPDTRIKWITLSGIYDSLAQGSDKFGRISDGLQFARSAIQFDKKLTNDKDIWNSQGNLALSLETYALLMQSNGDLNNALRTMRESLGILERMAVGLKDDALLNMNIGCGHWDIGTLLGERDELLGFTNHNDAASELKQSLVYLRTNIRLDPSEQEARINMAGSAVELGGILQESDPAAALAAYDEGVAALRFMPAENGRRNSFLSIALSESTLPLLKLGRVAEAQKRLAEAKQLAAKEAAPASGESLESPMESLARAKSAELSASGHYPEAIRLQQEWLQPIEAHPLITQVRLSNALIVSAHYRQLASLYRQAGQLDQEKTALQRREQLLNSWRQKLNNPHSQ